MIVLSCIAVLDGHLVHGHIQQVLGDRIPTEQGGNWAGRIVHYANVFQAPSSATDTQNLYLLWLFKARYESTSGKYSNSFCLYPRKIDFV